MQMHAVADLAELLRATIADEAIVLAGFRSGFFAPERECPDFGSLPIDQAAQFLAEGNPKRFWDVLEEHLFAGRGAAAKNLLLLRCRYELRHRRYPMGFGSALLHLVQSLPPATRRIRIHFPLVPMDLCLRLARYAKDEEDIYHFLLAVRGKTESSAPKKEAGRTSTVSASRDAKAAVDTVLTELGTQKLSQEIGLPIDGARASFALEHVTTESYDAFVDAVSSFYVSLLRHTGSLQTGGDDQISADALALLGRTFARKGGVTAAVTEAREGLNGGLRFVLDQMTEQYKAEQMANRVAAVLKKVVDPRSWVDRTAFMAAFLERVGPHLSPETRSQPAERFAHHYEEIVQSYVHSMNGVAQLWRTL